ncbi:MAG: magnesium/cobalt transporter CorA [Proteobacteria bacterium]|nr:magnesium/cobalt transporter CorA [Pseudomonadota bacterium]MBU4468887.1 magnesium/cobalt transporter CorA [Pseudomonadota bacterium]MCG2750880.1 magnesium/cobalt transporter CorA [Desulfobacteraceae bacterium]
MKRFTKETYKKSGMSPGSLIHIGDKKIEQPLISFFDYDEANCMEKQDASMENISPVNASDLTAWINIDGIHDAGVIETIGKHFNIHALTLEDIMHTGQRPKVEEFEDYLYVVIKMLTFEEGQDKIHSEQVSFILGDNFLVSFQENHGDVFDAVRERIRKAKGRIRKKKADYLLYALMDAIVDNYFLILESLGDRIESLEEEMLGTSHQTTLVTLHNIKQELIFFRRQVWHVRDFLNVLEKGDKQFFQESTTLFLRDLHDHTVQVIDAIESYRDLLTGMQDLSLSHTSARMNEVMKILTIISTIFIPITFLAGVYGMNFKFMPEIDKPWAYPAFWFIVIVVILGMVFFFRRKKWL